MNDRSDGNGTEHGMATGLISVELERLQEPIAESLERSFHGQPPTTRESRTPARPSQTHAVQVEAAAAEPSRSAHARPMRLLPIRMGIRSAAHPQDCLFLGN